jgi:hypothetical protein
MPCHGSSTQPGPDSSAGRGRGHASSRQAAVTLRGVPKRAVTREFWARTSVPRESTRMLAPSASLTSIDSVPCVCLVTRTRTRKRTLVELLPDRPESHHGCKADHRPALLRRLRPPAAQAFHMTTTWSSHTPTHAMSAAAATTSQSVLCRGTLLGCSRRSSAASTPASSGYRPPWLCHPSSPPPPPKAAP